MRRLLVPLLIILVLGGAFFWWWTRPERVVARRTADLFEAANVPADAGNITRSTRGTAIEGFLAPRITFEGPDGPTDEVEGPQPRDRVATMYAALAKFCRSATIQDLQIESVTVNGEEAQVIATADAVIDLPNDERPVDGIQNFDLTWRKIEGKWLMEKAKWSESPR